MIATPFEILIGSAAGFDYPTSSFCLLIPQYEQALTHQCLGKDLYDFMVSKMNEYPENVTAWDQGAEYSIDDYVVRNYYTYKSTANSNTSDPAVFGSSWERFAKFNHAGATELWDEYLMRLIAMRVYNSSLPLVTYRAGAGGVIINTGYSSGERTANKAEMLTLNVHHEGLIEMITTNMVKWLSDNWESKGLPTPSCAKKCNVIGKHSRRWGFR